MEKQIELNKKQLKYTLKRSYRAKRVRLAIYSPGQLVVTSPNYISQSFIEKFIIAKANWIFNKLDYFKLNSPRFFIKDNKQDYISHKAQAMTFAQARVNHFNKLYNFKVKKISIKNQKTRWGSCSRKGNLNFNYKLIKLPRELADYIIVHELCHLKEFNHSRRFWKLVEEIIPNYLQLRHELKKGNINFI